MLGRLILLMTIVPIVELYLLVKIGAWAGDALVPIGIVIVTGIVGATLARHEGFRVWRNIEKELSVGNLPADGLIDAVLILCAGLLLITPGVLTDFVGFVALVPPTRALLRRAVKGWFGRRMAEGKVRMYRNMGFGPIRDDRRAEDDE